MNEGTDYGYKGHKGPRCIGTAWSLPFGAILMFRILIVTFIRPYIKRQKPNIKKTKHTAEIYILGSSILE
jgi:hypothetical protein